MLTAENLRGVLDYDPSSGVFRWRGTGRGRKHEVAGCRRRRDGRLVIYVEGSRYLANRLAWLWMTGEWPRVGVDHRDGDPTNDRWGNLRLATQSENNRNARTPRHNTTGFKGAYRCRGKFRAAITVNDRTVHLGVFDTAEEAHAAYCAAAVQHGGEFARFA